MFSEPVKLGDASVVMRVRSTLKEDDYGYFIEMKVAARDVAVLLRNGVVPIWDDTEKEFYVIVTINNVTQFTFNSHRVDSLVNPTLKNFSVKRIKVAKGLFKPYSKGTPLSQYRSCRAMVLDICYGG